MAKLLDYQINVEAEEEEEGGISISPSGEASRSATQPSAGLPQSEINPYSPFLDSGSSPMDTESDLNNCLIDFLGRESNTGRNQMQRIACDVEDIYGGFDVMEKEIELGLGIGASSGELRGDSVTGDKENDSGRVEVGTDLFCEEEAMLMDDEVLEWENMQNDITWESDPVQASREELEEEEDEEEEEEEDTEEEEEEGDELTLPLRTALHENIESQFLSPVINNDTFVEDFYEESLDAEDILMESMEGTSLMDFNIDDFFLHELGGDYSAVFATPFNQQPPPPIIGTRPASKRVVDDLPLVDITSEELSNRSIVCAICIGDLVVEEKVTRLPCRHYYHGECIVPWLEKKNTCPVCRYELPSDDVECVTNRSRM